MLNPVKGRPYDLEMTAEEAADQYNPPPDNHVPTCDEPGVATVPNWSPATSFVVSGPLGDTAQFPGTRFPNHNEARQHCVTKYGKVLAFNYIPGRWFARVPKPVPK